MLPSFISMDQARQVNQLSACSLLPNGALIYTPSIWFPKGTVSWELIVYMGIQCALIELYQACKCIIYRIIGRVMDGAPKNWIDQAGRLGHFLEHSP